MKLILGGDPNADRFETRRREEKIRRQLRREDRAEGRRQGVRWLLGQARGVFVLLLAATVLEFIFAHHTEIQQFADARIDRTVTSLRSSNNPSPIRQSAVNHEKEVNQVITK